MKGCDGRRVGGQSASESHGHVGDSHAARVVPIVCSLSSSRAQARARVARSEADEAQAETEQLEWQIRTAMLSERFAASRVEVARKRTCAEQLDLKALEARS